MSPSSRKTSPRGGRPSGADHDPGLERAELLRDVVARAAESARAERQGPTVPSRARGPAIAFAAIAVGFATYSLVARPEFLWGPRASLLAPQVSEANVRVSMAIIAGQIDEYERTYGHLPASLAALGEAGGIVRYQMFDDTAWVLTAEAGGKRLELRRGTPVRAFLGDALSIVRQGAR